jgi:hypothetical protein
MVKTERLEIFYEMLTEGQPRFACYGSKGGKFLLNLMPEGKHVRFVCNHSVISQVFGSLKT